MNRGIMILVALTLAQVLTAQQMVSPMYEVASVRPSPPSATGPTISFQPGGRFVATGITVRNLITLAFGVRDEDVRNAPSWLGTKRFDINARPPASAASSDRDAHMMRVQALLNDRFRLKVSRSTEDRKVLALVPAKTGVKLQAPRNGQCPGQSLVTTLGMLARSLSLQLGTPVVDQTGLEGNYCVRIAWVSDDGKSAAIGVGNKEKMLAAPEPANGPSLPTALREQLGLTLETRRSPVPVLVINYVTQPTEN
jgi:uncharacterized protein (TIGR03435 family)